ncbi:MAG: acyl-CoA dehydrogenase, partial [Halioglobus sp.]|nr:acyl-CoA dehydrogenase [Halioglobus sp.]
YVPDGHVADVLVVVARTAGERDATNGLSLFLVEREAQGVTVQRRILADGRNMAEVRFDAASGELLGTAGQAWPVIDKVIDRANAVLAAEMLGSAQAAFERTMEYLKTREQFGALIGTFQALQHRAAQMFCEIELSKSAVLKALEAVDTDAPDVALCSSLAKVQVSEMLRLVSDEAIQMHGGIGMTDEEDVGLYLKRARVAQQMLGDENYHLDRYARLRGY